METLSSCSERDLKPIKMKMLELDTELKIWGNLLKQTENVLCEFDKDIEAYKARESQRTRFTIACTFAIIGMQKTFFHVFLILPVKVNFCCGRQKSWRRIPLGSFARIPASLVILLFSSALCC